MKRITFAFVALFFATLSYAQIEGKWKTIDDETGQAKSIVEITKKTNGKYYGKIAQLLIKPADPNCTACKDETWYGDYPRFEKRWGRIHRRHDHRSQNRQILQMHHHQRR